MESVMADVKQKLKAAIKAKLMELGRYVDDQLPTYVMVMVTNRRSKKEMDKELQLFLGDDTDHFTTWLQSVGQKLEEVTNPVSGKSSSLKRKPSCSENEKKKKKRVKKDVESDSESKSSKSVPKIGEGISNTSIEALEAEINEILKDEKTSPDTVPKSDKTDRKSAESSKVKEFEEEDFLNIKEEDIEDFLNQEEETPKEKSAVPSSSKVPTPGNSSNASSSKPGTSERKIPNETQKTQEREPAVQPSSTSENAEKPPKPRISRQAIRAAQAVICENLQVEEVKSGAHRRSSSESVKPRIPAARSVELKPKDEENALPDARELLNRKRRLVQDKSSRSPDEGYRYEKQRASRGTKHDSRYKVDRSKMRKEKSPPPGGVLELSSSDDDATARGKTKTDRQEQSKLKSRGSLSPESDMKRIKRTIPNDRCRNDENTGERERERKKRIIVVESTEEGNIKRRTVESVANIAPKPPRPKLSINESGSGNLVRKAFAEVQRSVSGPKYVEKERGSVTVKRNIQEDTLEVQTTSRKEKSPVKQSKKTAYAAKEDKKFTSKEDVHRREVTEEQTPSEVSVPTRTVESRSAKVAVSSTQPKERTGGKQQSGIIQLRLNSEIPVIPEIQKPPNAFFVKKAPEPVEEYDPTENMPQFVVTLAGVDKNLYTDANVTELEMKETVPGITTPFMDIDAEQEMVELSESLQKRKMERCRFWPSCLNGENCPYVHPTTLCKMFPNCKFGNACLYIHPKCKFDALCSRFDCPYLHTDESLRKTKMAGGATFATGGAPFKTAVFKQPCKYFPHCTNAMCPYLHPKLCRYDKRCQNKNCPFTHTSFKHVASKMRWVNPELAAAATSTAVSVSSETSSVITPSSDQISVTST